MDKDNADKQGQLFENPSPDEREIDPRRPAPFVAGSDTSEAAAASVRKPGGKLRMRVLKFVADQGETGATCDEAERGTGLIHQTTSARMRELAQLWLIADSGARRATSTGRKAAVMVVTKSGLAELKQPQPGEDP